MLQAPCGTQQNFKSKFSTLQMSIVKGKIYFDRFHFSFFFLKEIQLKS